MQKCVKISLFELDIDAISALYSVIKKKAQLGELEGVARPADGDLEMIVRGPKALVDSFIAVVDEVATKYGIQEKMTIGIAVEPCFNPEDYRGVFRFLLTEAK